jgi:hypothetical protein
MPEIIEKSRIEALEDPLDLRVADEVMGLEWRPVKPFYSPEGWYPKGFHGPVCNEHGEGRYRLDYPHGYEDDLPAYHYDHEATQKVKDRMRREGYRLKLAECGDGFYAAFSRDDLDAEPWQATRCKSEQVAVCTAALNALKGETAEESQGRA